jgi:hypothetical protein
MVLEQTSEENNNVNVLPIQLETNEQNFLL